MTFLTSPPMRAQIESMKVFVPQSKFKIKYSGIFEQAQDFIPLSRLKLTCSLST